MAGWSTVPRLDRLFLHPVSSPSPRPSEHPMPTVSALDHIAIATANLAESLAFYERALGLRPTHVEKLPERGIRVAFLPIGDTRIELIEPLHDASEVSAFLSKRGGGIHHLAFRSGDVDNAVAELKAEGIRLTSDEAAPGAHGCRVAFIHPKSSGGTLIELSTPPDAHGHE